MLVRISEKSFAELTMKADTDFTALIQRLRGDNLERSKYVFANTKCKVGKISNHSLENRSGVNSNNAEAYNNLLQVQQRSDV